MSSLYYKPVHYPKENTMQSINYQSALLHFIKTCNDSIVFSSVEGGPNVFQV